MTPALRVGATGFGLIAVCYGFARFAFGLFLPRIRGDLALSSNLAGVISGGGFAAYCVAIVVSARLSEQLGHASSLSPQRWSPAWACSA